MKKKLLIVDDSAHIREAYTAWFHGEGFEVYSVSDGSLALDEYKKRKPDIVLMDKTMPELDGISATKIIIKYDPKAKIIVCSADPVKKEALEAGAVDFVEKGMRGPSYLSEVIKKYL